jgi:molecular chaperone GrpE
MSEKKHDQEHKAEKEEKTDPAGPRAPSSPETEPDQPAPAAEDAPKSEAANPPAGEGQMGEDRSSGHKPTKREAEVRALRQERDELKDKYLRALAEMDNLRKRAEREKSEFYQFALAEVLKDLLTVADSFERALQAEDQADGKVFQEGVRMIQRQLLDVLARQGVTPILDVVGSRFDPGLHQALSSEEADGLEEAVVSEEMQRGYRLRDRLLRPALVKVKIPRQAPVD